MRSIRYDARVKISKLGAVLAGVYLVLVVAVVVWANTSAQANPTGGEELGLLAFYLTLPFSLILSIVLEVLRAGLLGSSLGLLIVLGVAAVINAAFLYFLGVALGKRFSGTGDRT